ncbi:MAG: lytic transglycosylase domain-containing protein [Gammaproteobacteria bacterium]|nr:lytic transglycosylase domain-containing protein [Gammaproteobacteria bacterium]
MPSLFRLPVLAGLYFIGNIALAAPPRAAVDPELRATLIRAVNESASFPDRFEAEVWLMDMSRRLEPKLPQTQYRIDFLKQVHHEATRAGLSPELVLAVIEVESNFNPFAISNVGARGLMQVMPFWLKEIGKPGDSLFRTQTNLRYGCTILKYYLNKENGNLANALARYNGSRGRYTYPALVNRALKTRWYRQ